MAKPSLSLTDHTVLALLGEGATHGFAIAQELTAESDLGRIFTVHRPLVYRSLDRLVERELAEPQQIEKGEGGPKRTIHGLTKEGEAVNAKWLASPVTHVRDLRIEFLTKLRLNTRANQDTAALIASQQAALAERIETLRSATDSDDEVDLWRRHNADAVAAFLAELQKPEV